MEKFFELSKEFKKVDEEIFEASKIFSMAVNSLSKIPNIHAYKEYSKIAEKLISKLNDLKPTKEFEKLFIENSLLNIGLQIDYLEYFTYGKKNNVTELAKKLLGEKFFDIIKSKAENFDYKKYWEYFLSYQEYTYRQVPSSEDAFRPEFEKILSDMKKDVLEYAKNNLGLEKDYDFDLVLGPSFKDETFFHPTNRRMEISPYSFFVYKDKEIKINNADVIRSIFHEIVGHGKQEANSKKMPLTMQDNSINTWMTQLHINFEGISLFAEKESLDFMRKFKEKYNLKDDYIVQISHQLDNRDSIAFQVLFDYFKLKSLEDKNFNAEEEFEKITKNKGLTINKSLANSNPLYFFKNSAYILGEKYLSKIIEDLKRDIGEVEYKKNFAVIDEAISTGVFHFSVWPKFVKLFLKENGLINKK